MSGVRYTADAIRAAGDRLGLVGADLSGSRNSWYAVIEGLGPAFATGDCLKAHKVFADDQFDHLGAGRDEVHRLRQASFDSATTYDDAESGNEHRFGGVQFGGIQ